LNVEPLYRLRLSTPRLKLRLGTREELFELGRLAQKGIHPPREMPFEVPWTDRSGEPEFVDDFVGYHETVLREWSPAAWSLNLLAFVDGRPVGSQTVRGEEFSTRREIDTGSWLGRAYQRQGLGTEMRTAVLELAFRELGARAATSGSVMGNESSKRVSEKLGYVVVSMSTIAPRGEPVTKYDLRIEKDSWEAPFPIEIEGTEGCLSLFGLSESA
jgi:RimJ/RimL family protein N-acetyltransferase